MTAFDYRDGELHVEDVALSELAERFGTPSYVYSRAAIESAWQAFDNALSPWPHRVCFAVKSNSNLGVLSVLAKLGSGFDIVSVGELERVLAAGGEASKIVFSGVGKRTDELERALDVGIHSFNVESLSEIDKLAEIAQVHGVRACVSLRINPDVDAHTHPYISTGLKENKFGIGHEIALDAYRRAAGHAALDVIGIDCHIGSQLTEVQPFVDAAARLLGLIDQLADEGIAIRELDLGGGQGVVYRDEQRLDLQAWQNAMRSLLDGRDLTVIVEPGRAVVADAGILLTRVSTTKDNGGRHFAVVDAAMNDLLRPALYQAWQRIEPVVKRHDRTSKTWDIVGPVCESADFLGKERELAIAEGDLLAVRSAGAYCAVMSSNYNTRPRAAEVLVDGATPHLVRRRESVNELFAGESVV